VHALGLTVSAADKVALAEVERGLLDPARVEAAVASLPRTLRLRLARAPVPVDLPALQAALLSLPDQSPAVELATAAWAAARVLESRRQRQLLDDLMTRAVAAEPVVPSAATQTRLRAGALAAIAGDYDLIGAARSSGLPLHVVALGFALHGESVGGVPALDHSLAASVSAGLRYGLSPAAPTRAVGESLLGRPVGQGGPEVGHLAWTVLVQVAAVPSGAAVAVEDLVELVLTDAGALELEHPTSRPAPTAALARRYLTILLGSLDALGLARVVSSQRVVLNGPGLQDILQDIADDRPMGAAKPATAASLRREGEELVLHADDRVPLASLLPLARHVLPRVLDDGLAFRLLPAMLRPPSQSRRILAAANEALA
jgi:hypothetical protein